MRTNCLGDKTAFGRKNIVINEQRIGKSQKERSHKENLDSKGVHDGIPYGQYFILCPL